MKACLRIRIDFEEGTILSPGKVRLLEFVDECGSLEAAAATIGMSCAQARWVIDGLEELFGAPLVVKDELSGRKAKLSELARKVVDRYRAAERMSDMAAERLLGEMVRLAPEQKGSTCGSTLA